MAGRFCVFCELGASAGVLKDLTRARARYYIGSAKTIHALRAKSFAGFGIMTTVWVFNGVRAPFPGGVFSTPGRARAWIAEHRLTGVLTAYPLDQGVYDWATAAGLFPADKPVGARFIGSFSSAHQEHYHFVDGVQEGAG